MTGSTCLNIHVCAEERRDVVALLSCVKSAQFPNLSVSYAKYTLISRLVSETHICTKPPGFCFMMKC